MARYRRGRGSLRWSALAVQTIKSPHIGPVLQILEDREGIFWFGTVQNTLVRYRQQKTAPQIRLLEEGTFERVGSNETLMAKTRIVAATNRDLREMWSYPDLDAVAELVKRGLAVDKRLFVA